MIDVPRPETPFRRALERWLDALVVERGLARNSIEAYRRDLLRLEEDLTRREKRDPLAADTAALAAHLRALRRAGLAPRSIRRALASMRGFYCDWSRSVSARTTRPSRLLPPKKMRELPKVLSEKQVEALLGGARRGDPAGASAIAR